MTLPLADPQFWIVTAAACVALTLVLRGLFRRPKTNPSPCARCAKNASPGDRRSADGARTKTLALILVLAGAAAGGPETARAEIVEREIVAMGTRLAMFIESADRQQGLAASAAIVAAVEDAERRLSTWRGASELQTFNAAPPGSRVPFSPFTWAAVTSALTCWEESAGAFDPTVAPLVETWGLRTGGRLPQESEIESARRAVGAERLVLEPDRRELLQAGGVRLEEGGFGKGAALDAALAAARQVAPAAAIHLDFGGQLAWTGKTRPFALLLADPRERSRSVLELTLDAPSGSLSTSANSERGSEVTGVRVGHLLDPRSGRPAPDFGSATTFAARATAADCRSTGLFVLGPERGAVLMSRWSREGEGEAVLLVVEPQGLRALVSPGLAARVRAVASDLRIEEINGVS